MCSGDRTNHFTFFLVVQTFLSIFKKTKTITQHLSYDNMTKLTLSTMKAAVATKKKTCQWHQSPKFYCIVLFLLAAWVVPLPAPLFYNFVDKQCRCNARLNRVIRSCFWCCFHLVSAKKGVMSSPTILVSSAASTLTRTSLSSTKALTLLLLSLLIVKLARQLFLGSP